MKTPSIMYVFEDSFTTPELCVDPKDSFWDCQSSRLRS
jgi:hypothetical protein